MRKGFTLVELSIVLVIIGLLIGGILVGQSLVETAKLQKLVRTLEQYDILIVNFKDRYGELPGDMTSAEQYWGDAGNCGTTPGTGTQTCDGNGDGTITYDWTGYSFFHEAYTLWEHLSNAGFLNETYTGAADTSCALNGCSVPGVNKPTTNYSDSHTVTMSFLSEAATWAGSRGRHAYLIGDPNNTYTAGHAGRWHGQAFTPAEQLAIDVKLDDGRPHQGVVYNMQGAGYTPNCASGINYNVDYEDAACIAMIDANLYE